MPKRTDIEKILILGAGPIIIGQACEFDYSGSQACKALREEGYTIILVNSNPATIMTDPDVCHRTYIEPITASEVEKVIAIERPDAILPTLGGQTALNVTVELHENGVLDRYDVEMIGANVDVIKCAEERESFKRIVEGVGYACPRSRIARSMDEAMEAMEELGVPAVVRPSFTLGGLGGGIVNTVEEFVAQCRTGLSLSPTTEVLIEESVVGWKEYELEVMRDWADNVVIVCSIENFDPMGIHTGDSITVAPAQTLTDREYQAMRTAAQRIIRAVGVETGGSNIQFAVNPDDGRMLVIEMNPRVSRSSALASKATGFPIAKIAAKLAVGYSLDEIPNDITQKTPACFEPTLDYCVVKIPKFNFEKFPHSDSSLGTQMKSVGEVMAIGRTFKEALQKGIRSMEQGYMGLIWDLPVDTGTPLVERIEDNLRRPNRERLFYIRLAFRAGIGLRRVQELTGLDPWFLNNIAEIMSMEELVRFFDSVEEIPTKVWWEAKRAGFSDQQLAQILHVSEDRVRRTRRDRGVDVCYKLVDTCAAEFEAYTPFYYSTYEDEDEARVSDRRKMVILGGGPNRIGQGIEFDYCCVQAAFALREDGYETVMINCNPETVSTDYDTSDMLFFEPLTFEDVMNICEKVRPEGVIVQLGGQTPLALASDLLKAGIHIVGTQPDCIDLAEDRERFQELLQRLRIPQPENGTAVDEDGAVAVAERIGYPVLVRPSYVLGGRGMEIVDNPDDLRHFMAEAVAISPNHPVLIDKFLQGAIEVDVDAVSDGEHTTIGGIMEHIERAGIHSGDSACVLPPHTLDDSVLSTIRLYTVLLASELEVVGLMNVQYAVQDDKVYVLEVNPRASRTVPFVSKALGVPLAKVAVRAMCGVSLHEQGFLDEVVIDHVAVKKSVFPFSRFPGTDYRLGPEMKSTGEVMGVDREFGAAFAKAQLAASEELPLQGNIFLSCVDEDKEALVPLGRDLHELGFDIFASLGTAAALTRAGVPVTSLRKIHEGEPNVLNYIQDGRIHLIVNTPSRRGRSGDGYRIRQHAVAWRVPLITTLSGAEAAVQGIRALKKEEMTVRAIQDYHADRERA
jgi:carbamoyl-phosphate synthase large subunit